MKLLILYDYPPPPGGLATQGDMLFRGLREHGIDVHPVSFESEQEKEWYYRWFRPDAVIGVGYWGFTPQIVEHPLRFGMTPVPWLVADGFVAEYQDILNELPLILATSNWVRDVYARDGLQPDKIEVLPVGCDTEAFRHRTPDEPKIAAVREALGVAPDQILILTIGGDAASKGAQEVMRALALIDSEVPNWKYVCKVWPQPRTFQQNRLDLELAESLGIQDKIVYTTNVVSRNFVPYLIGACDIYAAPSHLEGFGMPQIEAGACEKPVIGIKAMAMLDTLVHGETAYLAGVDKEIVLSETEATGPNGEGSTRVAFPTPKVVDYRPNVEDIAEYLLALMKDPDLRHTMGVAGRKRVVERFDYRVVADRLVQLIADRMGVA
jgi:glycosyltransferase involved in cell wall biosynthesis